MKQFLLIVSIILVLSLVGCMEPKKTSQDGETSSSESTTTQNKDYSQAKIEGFWNYQYSEDDPFYCNFSCDYGATIFNDSSDYTFFGTYTRNGNEVNIHYNEYSNIFFPERYDTSIDVTLEFVAEDTLRVKTVPPTFNAKVSSMSESGELVLGNEEPVSFKGFVPGYLYVRQ